MTTPNEIFPPFMFDDLPMLAIYAYCVSKTSPTFHRWMVNGRCIEKKPNEAILTRPIDPRLGIADAEAIVLLEKLHELSLVEFQDSGAFIRVRLPNISFQPNSREILQSTASNHLIPNLDLRAFSDRYLQYVENNQAPKSLENARRVMKHANRFWGARLISDLSPVDLEKFKAARLDEGVTPTTVNMEVRTLKAGFNQAIVWGYLSANPFEKVRQIRQERRIPVMLSREEFELLISATNNHTMRTLFKLAVLTGMRRGELLNLKWEDVDLVNGFVTIQSSGNYRVKHGKARIIPMLKGVREVLREAGHHDPYVLMTDRDRPIDPNFATKKFKMAVVSLGLDERLKLHSLRATFASWAKQDGMPIGHIQEMLGHAYQKTTEAYTRIPTDGLRAWTDKLDFGIT